MLHSVLAGSRSEDHPVGLSMFLALEIPSVRTRPVTAPSRRGIGSCRPRAPAAWPGQRTGSRFIHYAGCRSFAVLLEESCPATPLGQRQGARTALGAAGSSRLRTRQYRSAELRSPVLASHEPLAVGDRDRPRGRAPGASAGAAWGGVAAVLRGWTFAGLSVRSARTRRGNVAVGSPFSQTRRRHGPRLGAAPLSRCVWTRVRFGGADGCTAASRSRAWPKFFLSSVAASRSSRGRRCRTNEIALS